MYGYKRKRARKKREAETSLYSLALRNAQRSYKTQLSLATLLISNKSFFWDQHSKWNRSENLIFFKFV